MEEWIVAEGREIMADLDQEFSPGSVPMKVVSKVMGMKPDTIRDWMEAGILDLGAIQKARKKRGKRSYRNTYISPKKLYDLTGYVWKGEKEAIEAKKE
ncbi:hypothetical protein EAI28_14990 [Faecalicatena contorta]|nr:hypothetical protein [Faecalicatena contorta]